MKLTWPPQRVSNRRLAAVPIVMSAILFTAIIVLGLPQSRDLNGGTLFMVRNLEITPDIDQVKSQAEIISNSRVRVIVVPNGFDIETGYLSEKSVSLIKDTLLKIGIGENSIVAGTLGPAVSSAHIIRITFALTGSFIVIGLIALILRRRVAAAIVLLTAGLDIVGILGLMTILRVPFSLASMIGIFITIGFAIDTNILLAWRLLKGAVGDPRENIRDSLKAGLLMSCISLAILLSANLFTTASMLDELSLALAFGVIVNIVNTWFLGAAIVLRHVERKKVGVYHVGV